MLWRIRTARLWRRCLGGLDCPTHVSHFSETFIDSLPKWKTLQKKSSHFSLNRHLTLFQLFVRQESQEADILTGNALFFRMHDIKDIYFVGGFGTVQWIDVDEYTQAQPDAIVTACTSAELQVTLPVPFIHFHNCFITRP